MRLSWTSPLVALLRLIAVATVIFAFAVARSEGCSMGTDCCADSSVSCPMLGPDGDRTGASLCKTICAALPSDMPGSASAASGEVVFIGGINFLAVLNLGPEPPPPRILKSAS